MLRRMRLRAPRRWWLALGVAFVVTACGTVTTGSGAAEDESITLYTCVNDTTVQPILGAFQSAHPGSEVRLFRAPTGELNARVASDVRSGGLKGDVVYPDWEQIARTKDTLLKDYQTIFGT
jgi:iron(III) transport system substrate-binding protein